MTPDSLAKQCVDAINGCTALGADIRDASVLIITPKGWKAPPRFPRGRMVRWMEDGSRVRYLPAVKTLEWLAATATNRMLTMT